MFWCLLVSYLGVVSLQLSFLQSVTPKERETESSESFNIWRHTNLFLVQEESASKVHGKGSDVKHSVGGGTFRASGQTPFGRTLLAQNIYGLIKVRDDFNIQENELGNHHMTQEGRKSCRGLYSKKSRRLQSPALLLRVSDIPQHPGSRTRSYLSSGMSKRELYKYVRG